MKFTKMIALTFLLYVLSVVSSKRRSHKANKLEVDHLSCRGCMNLKETFDDKSKHFACPHDKKKQCMSCSVNPNKKNECKNGCFRLADKGNHPCLIQKN